ncbi:hypothetical protein [Sphaerotilus sp.]|uniref:hypothetical protein n=1 Tax=Sphaerotilus sp. TaxID=2093942 RepID=UPI002ACDC435|nr:hypothetical protein [Sphaerotilus sp.]MDZ7857441.1 hypothetical protein [Sphaerotilus sp.]
MPIGRFSRNIKDDADYFSRAVLPAWQQARFFQAKSWCCCPHLEIFLLMPGNEQVLCWFGYASTSLTLTGNWTKAFPATPFEIEFQDDSGQKINFSVRLKKSDGEFPMSAAGVLDKHQVLTRSAEEVEAQARTDRQPLLNNMRKSLAKSHTAHLRVPYAVGDDLMTLVSGLDKSKVSAEAFEKAIGTFLAERGIEPVAG